MLESGYLQSFPTISGLRHDINLFIPALKDCLLLHSECVQEFLL